MCSQELQERKWPDGLGDVSAIDPHLWGHEIRTLNLHNEDIPDLEEFDTLFYLDRAWGEHNDSPLRNYYSEKKHGKEGALQKYREMLWRAMKQIDLNGETHPLVKEIMKIEWAIRGGQRVYLAAWGDHPQVVKKLIMWAMGTGAEPWNKPGKVKHVSN